MSDSALFVSVPSVASAPAAAASRVCAHCGEALRGASVLV
jgi:hypothetical protein